MKFKVTYSFLFIAFFLIANISFAQTVLPETLYVSPSGDDSSLGKKDSPINSLKEALRRKALHPDRIDKIILREGTYRFEQTQDITPSHSGTKGQPFLIAAYPGEKVFFSGGITVPSTLIKTVTDKNILQRLPKSARGKVVEMDLTSFSLEYGKFGPRGFNRPYIPAPNELFVNETAQQIARWPNPGEDNIKIGQVLSPGSVPRHGDFSNKGAIFKWNTERPKNWAQAQDVYLSGFFQWGYADDAIPVSKIDQKNKTFELALPHLYGVGNQRPFNTYFAINLLEEIDLPGEYFIDQSNQKLYFYPAIPVEEIEKIQLSSLEAPLLSFIDASHITVSGITVENSRGMGIYIEGGESITIKNSVFRNLGTVAINIGQGIEADTLAQHTFTGEPKSHLIGSLYAHLYDNTLFNRKAGKNHLIESCDIYDTGAGGIILGGGDRKSLIAANNMVSNCHIYRFNRLDRTYKAAVNIDGVGNIVKNCLIHDAPGTAIYLHGNNHVIEYNEVHHVMMDGDDQGAYYLGRDPSEFNNVVRYNYFHNIGISPTTHSTWTIYYDDGASGNIAYGNVFRKAGKGGVFLIGGGKYNKIFNNIFVDNSLVFHIDDRNSNWAKSVLDKGGIFEKRLSAVHIEEPPYSAYYPELKNFWNDRPELPSNVISQNVFYKNQKLVDKTFETTVWENNWTATSDPGFVDSKNLNYNLKKNSAVFDSIPEFEDIPFNKMGLKETPFRKTEVAKDGRIYPSSIKEKSRHQSEYIINSPKINKVLSEVIEKPSEPLIFPNPHPDAKWFGVGAWGLFMHWGIHSITGSQPSWAMIKGYPYGYESRFDNPQNYFQLVNTFNPKNWNPEKIAKAAKKAGMSYMVLTVKHHDGFALWPSKYGDFNIRTKFPDQMDLVDEYVKACRKHGLKVGFYFSQQDWHFPEYPVMDFDFNYHMRGKYPNFSPITNQERYHTWLRYTIAQLEELLTNYGKIDLLWFDGFYWPEMETEHYTLGMINWIRSIQPGIVINDRWNKIRAPDTQMEYFGVGDFATVEWKEAESGQDRWWEYTTSWNSHWGYSPFRLTPVEVKDLLIKTRSLGGNFLINVGPNSDGELPQKFYDYMEELSTMPEIIELKPIIHNP
ncbi:hypothetical protein GCM10028791_27340 [Echinicola sediminis]